MTPTTRAMLEHTHREVTSQLTRIQVLMSAKIDMLAELRLSEKGLAASIADLERDLRSQAEAPVEVKADD